MAWLRLDSWAGVFVSSRYFLGLLLAVLVQSPWQCTKTILSAFAGIGFAKNMEGNLEMMSGLQRIRSQLKGSIQGMPMLLGPSRKGFLGKLTGSVLQPVHDLCLHVMPCDSALPVSTAMSSKERYIRQEES